MTIEKIIVTVRETLEKMLGDKYIDLPENERVNVTICLLYKLAENDERIMDIIADHMYEILRAE